MYYTVKTSKVWHPIYLLILLSFTIWHLWQIEKFFITVQNALDHRITKIGWYNLISYRKHKWNGEIVFTKTLLYDWYDVYHGGLDILLQCKNRLLLRCFYPREEVRISYIDHVQTYQMSRLSNYSLLHNT